MSITLEYVADRLDEIQETLLSAKTMLTAPEAAKYLSISQGYLYRLMSNRAIPAYRPSGKKLFFHREELDRWLMQNPIRTKAEIQESAEHYTRTHPNPAQ
jgi:excisionase family DNA binding protein